MELREGENKKQISKEAIIVTVERPRQLSIQSRIVNQGVCKIGVQSPWEEGGLSWRHFGFAEATEDTAKQCSPRMFGEEAVKSGYVDIINEDFEEIPLHINFALESAKQHVWI